MTELAAKAKTASRALALLSTEEKAFIAKNFKTESAAQSDAPQLGRFLDVVA